MRRSYRACQFAVRAISCALSVARYAHKIALEIVRFTLDSRDINSDSLYMCARAIKKLFSPEKI